MSPDFFSQTKVLRLVDKSFIDYTHMHSQTEREEERNTERTLYRLVYIDKLI